MNSFPQKPTAIKATGALIITIVVAILLMAFFDNTVPSKQTKHLGERAFGNLVQTQESQTTLENSVPSGLGGDTKIAETETSDVYPILPDFMPIDEIIAYEYIYEGELPNLSTIDTRVFKKNNSLTMPDVINEKISNLQFDWLSLSSFDDLRVTSLSLNEANTNGFSISLDFINGYISIYKNSAMLGVDYSQPLSANDLPNDETLIEMSDEFLRQIGLDKSGYSSPTIDRSWIDTDVWVPESMQITYPIKIEGREVYAMSGLPTGLGVSANLRTDKIDALYGPLVTSYETSNYEITSNPQAILDIAIKGGLWEYQPKNASKTFRATLGAPDIVWAEYYSYNESSMNQVLYVPALRFPVISIDENAPYKKQWVIVPLVKEILEAEASMVEPQVLVK